MTRRGGDHELDVAAILRRAQEPAGLAELRQAIEKLGIDEATRSLAQIMEVVLDTREQLQGLAHAIEKVAAGSDAPHLLDVSKMDSYTVEYVLPPGPGEIFIDAPDPFNFFEPKAISCEIVDAIDPSISVCGVTIERVEISQAPQLVGPIRADRWRAPPGRGHPVDWSTFACRALMHNLWMWIRVDAFASVKLLLTISGVGRNALPPYRPTLPSRPPWSGR